VELERLRAEYLESVDCYERAASAMRDAMNEADQALAAVRTHVETGSPLTEVLPAIRPAAIRDRLSTAANDLERSRHAAQRLVFSMLVAEGLTMAEVGRTFGVSRSLVSRMIHEDD